MKQSTIIRTSLFLVAQALGVSAVSGCASLKAITDAVGSAGSAIGSALEGPKVDFSRPVPADSDLPGVRVVGIGKLEGDGAKGLDSLLKERLSESGRFKVASAAQLADAAQANSCDDADSQCLARNLPGFALLTGRVLESKYDEDTSESQIDCPDTEKQKTKKCFSQVRAGKARVVMQLRLKGPDGKVLAERSLDKTKEKEESNVDGKAKEIDSKALLEQARTEGAEEFLALINPHRVKETLELESDDDIPELERGVEKLQQGATNQAIQLLQVATTSGAASKDAELKAKAHYSLGVALMVDGKYDSGMKELRVAQGLAPDDDWAELIQRGQKWSTEATRFERQVALGKEAPPAPAPAPAPTPELDAAAPASGTTEAAALP